MFQKIVSWLRGLIGLFSSSRLPSTILKLAKCMAATVIALALLVLVTAYTNPSLVKEWMAYLGERTAKIARFLPPPLPKTEKKIEKAVWLEQNWSDSDRLWFHHTSQGTATLPVPYDWFVSLVQPEIFVFGSPKYLADPDYLGRFGFIPSLSREELTDTDRTNLRRYGYGQDTGSTAGMQDIAKVRDEATRYPANDDRLPVGLARLRAEDHPEMLKEDMIGFTCAACHTGHLEYKGVSLRFDGGPAMLDLGKLEGAIGLSIAYTRYLPWRFSRFADKVLERRGVKKKPAAEYSKQKKKLKSDLIKVLAYLRVRLDWRTAILDGRKAADVDEGFGRLDALNRIGNQVFFENLLPAQLKKCAIGLRLADDDEETHSLKRQCSSALNLPEDTLDDIPHPSEELAGNFRRIDAPVSFPAIWSVPWFTWAQYDASVLNELVRNAGEALGVKAKINTAEGAKGAKYKSTVELENIYWMEEMLRGGEPLRGKPSFKGLLAPKWPAKHFPKDKEAWAINQDLADKGRGLYALHCAECHRGPVNDPQFETDHKELSLWNEKNWRTMGGKKYLKLVQIPVGSLGTDPQQAYVLSQRKVQLPKHLKLDPIKILNRDLPHNDCDLPADPLLKSLFATALMGIVDKTIDRWFIDNPRSPEKEALMRGTRRNCPNPKVFPTVVQLERSVTKDGSAEQQETQPAPDTATGSDRKIRVKKKIVVRLHYRARPLDGIWSTAPYLHNGSVPNLDQLLRKASDRVKEFCVGNREFDPQTVGLKVELPEKGKRRDKAKKCRNGYTRLNTRALGNSNAGHSFEGEYQKDGKNYPRGVVGPAFDDEQRKALIEYLKTL